MFRPMRLSAFFRCFMSNLEAYMELRNLFKLDQTDKQAKAM